MTGVTACATAAPAPFRFPVHRVIDGRANCSPAQLDAFWWKMWPEAVREFSSCGIELTTSDTTGEIRRSPASRPIFEGVRRNALNVVVTRELPLAWARGRGVAGVTVIWEGFHVCVIAMDHAHVNRIPLLAVNTLVHEMLHAFLQDVYVTKASWSQMEQHELRVNWLATRLWLRAHCPEIRQSAEAYLRRLIQK